MSKNWICSWQWKSSRTRQQYYRSESFAMKTGIPTDGSMVKNHIWLRTEFGLSATQRTLFLSWFQACQVLPLDLHQLQGHLWDRRVVLHHLLHPQPSSPTVGDLSVREREDVTNSDISPVPMSELVDDSSGRPDETQANKNPKTKKETTITRVTRCVLTILRFRNGCKNSGEFGGWWNSMTREALTPVHLMKPL